MSKAMTSEVFKLLLVSLFFVDVVFFSTLHFSFEYFYFDEPIKIDLFPTNEHAAAHECQIRFIIVRVFFSVQSTPQTRRFKFDVMIELFETKAKINWISSRSFEFNVWLNHRKWMKKKRNEHILGVEWSWDGKKTCQVILDPLWSAADYVSVNWVCLFWWVWRWYLAIAIDLMIPKQNWKKSHTQNKPEQRIKNMPVWCVWQLELR